MAYRRAMQPKKQLTELRGITKWPIDLGPQRREFPGNLGSSDERYCSFAVLLNRSDSPTHTQPAHQYTPRGWGVVVANGKGKAWSRQWRH